LFLFFFTGPFKELDRKTESWQLEFAPNVDEMQYNHKISVVRNAHSQPSVNQKAPIINYLARIVSYDQWNTFKRGDKQSLGGQLNFL